MTTIGIHINNDSTSIAELSCKNGRYTLRRAQKAPRSANTAIENLHTGGKFSKKTKIAINAPSNKIFFQPLTTSVNNQRDLQQLLKFQMEEDFPIQFDELITTIIGKRVTEDDQTQYLISAISRADLQNTIDTVKDTKLPTPTLTVDAAALAELMSLDTTFARTDNSMIIHADASNIILTICDKGSPVYIRHLNYEDFAANNAIDITKLINEIQLTLLAAFTQSTPTDLKIFITEPTRQANELCKSINASTASRAVIINPLSNIIRDDNIQIPDSDITLAVALAVAATKPEDQPIFQDTEISTASHTADVKRAVYVFASMLVILAVLLTGKFFYTQKILEYQNETLNKKIRSAFVQTVPDEKNIVDELAQISTKVSQLQLSRDALSTGIANKIHPLKTLSEISYATPDKNIIIDMISITPGQTRLSGTAPSFDSVDKFLSSLRKLPRFTDAIPKSIDALPQQNRVRFTISAKMGATKQ